MPAAALNAFHNVLLRSVTGDKAFSITVNNHPLPRNFASLQVLNIDFIPQCLQFLCIVTSDNRHSLRPYWFWYQCTHCIWL